jgi:hypothetical protein
MVHYKPTFQRKCVEQKILLCCFLDDQAPIYSSKWIHYSLFNWANGSVNDHPFGQFCHPQMWPYSWPYDNKIEAFPFMRVPQSEFLASTINACRYTSILVYRMMNEIGHPGHINEGTSPS